MFVIDATFSTAITVASVGLSGNSEGEGSLVVQASAVLNDYRDRPQYIECASSGSAGSCEGAAGSSRPYLVSDVRNHPGSCPGFLRSPFLRPVSQPDSSTSVATIATPMNRSESCHCASPPSALSGRVIRYSVSDLEQFGQAVLHATGRRVHATPCTPFTSPPHKPSVHERHVFRVASIGTSRQGTMRLIAPERAARVSQMIGGKARQ